MNNEMYVELASLCYVSVSAVLASLLVNSTQLHGIYKVAIQ